MGKLVDGDDGLRAEEVGPWIEEKTWDVKEYVRLSHGARQSFVGPRNAGGTYIDLFCGTGRARIRNTVRFVDGAAVVAWKTSMSSGSPFTSVFIADLDSERRSYCATRLKRLGAPVEELQGSAVEAARSLLTRLHTEALHFAFLDPYNLGSLAFSMLRALSAYKRMEMLVHISAMDLTRNIESESDEDSEFDAFAPGWRDAVPVQLPRAERRQRVLEYWAALVKRELALNADSKTHPIRNSRKALMYWLLLLYRHPLAGKFWDIVTNHRPQSTLEMF